MSAPARRIAVIGAGWAGLSAAVRLTQAGCHCTVFEAARSAGGRARRVDWKTSDGQVLALDNGQHLLLGAYHATLALMDTVGIDPQTVLRRTRLSLQSVQGFRMRAAHLPAPLHLAYALASARGLPWRDRFAMLTFMSAMRRARWQLSADQTVSALLAAHHQPARLRALVWEPLCLAALNTPANDASAQVFLNVLRDSLGGARAASDLLLPRTDLSQVLPDAVLNYLARQNPATSIRYGERVGAIHLQEPVVMLESTLAQASFDGAVLATSARHAAPLLAALPGCTALATSCRALAYQSITTVYLRYQVNAQQPLLKTAMLALHDNPADQHFGQWAFDHARLSGRSGLIAAVISANGAHRDLNHDRLAAAIDVQLRHQAGISAPLIESRVLTEKHATFSCTPALHRPGHRTPAPRLVLAGDYTQSDYPATLESAIASGAGAARTLLEQL